MRLPVADGGVAAELDGGYFPEEYPSIPHSYVLNGALFALWGLHDVAVALDDPAARELLDDGARPWRATSTATTSATGRATTSFPIRW